MANVAVGGYALQMAGLASYYVNCAQSTCDVSLLNGHFVAPFRWYYLPDVSGDKKHIKLCLGTVYGNVYYPTAERAIVDNIRHQDVFEEFFLVEALQRYERDNPDLVKLREVAAEYGQSEQLEYWLEEARNDFEV